MAEWFGPSAEAAVIAHLAESADVITASGTATSTVTALPAGGAARRRKSYAPVTQPHIIIPSRGSARLGERPDAILAHGTSTPWHRTAPGQQDEETVLLLVA